MSKYAVKIKKYREEKYLYAHRVREEGVEGVHDRLEYGDVPRSDGAHERGPQRVPALEARLEQGRPENGYYTAERECTHKKAAETDIGRGTRKSITIMFFGGVQLGSSASISGDNSRRHVQQESDAPTTKH